MRAWLRGPLLGALLGLPILGGGGRLAMHGVSLLATDAQHSVTVQGTVTVLVAGLAAGTAAGAMYALLARVLPARRLARDALFAVLLVLLTLRGLKPVSALTLALFMPVVLVYGVALERAWHARSPSTRPPRVSP
jgi:putative exporter of polyketide antibiotics